MERDVSPLAYLAQDGSLHAHFRQDSGILDADDPASNHGQRVRQLLQVRHLHKYPNAINQFLVYKCERIRVHQRGVAGRSDLCLFLYIYVYRESK